MDGTAAGILVLSLMATVAAMALPPAYPNAPILLWRALFWFGVVGMAVSAVYLIVTNLSWPRIGAYGLIAGGVIAVAIGVAWLVGQPATKAEIPNRESVSNVVQPQPGKGGKGGSAESSQGGTALGGPGGSAGTGTGGDGGNAQAYGPGSVAAGGEGGAGPNADGTGGHGGRSGAEIYYEKIGKPMPDYLKGYGRGADGGNQSTPSITVTNSPGSIVAPSGGNNTVVNQAPEPDLKIELGSTQEDRDGTFTSTALIEIVAPYPPAQLYLEAHAKDIVAFKVDPQRSGVHAYGLSGKRESFSFTTIMSPFGKYRVTIQTKTKPRMPIEVTYKFD